MGTKRKRDKKRREDAQTDYLPQWDNREAYRMERI